MPVINGLTFKKMNFLTWLFWLVLNNYFWLADRLLFLQSNGSSLRIQSRFADATLRIG